MTPERLNRFGLIGIALTVVAVLVFASSQFVLSSERTATDTLPAPTDREAPLTPTSTVPISPIALPSSGEDASPTAPESDPSPPTSATTAPTTSTAEIEAAAPETTIAPTTTAPASVAAPPETTITTDPAPTTATTTAPPTTTITVPDSTSTTTTEPATTTTEPATTTTEPPTTTTITVPEEPAGIYVRSFSGRVGGEQEEWSVRLSVRLAATGPGSLSAQVAVTWDGANPGGTSISTTSNGRGSATITGLRGESVRFTIASVQSSAFTYQPALNRASTSITIQSPADD